MMTLEVLRQLRAYQAGKPLPKGEKKSFHIAAEEDVLLLSFVRMGGESRPWGIAFGCPNKTPKLLAVAEARNRDLVAGMIAGFASTLLRHYRHRDHTKKPVTSESELAPLRQVWLPNESHLEMLHHLAFAYTWTKFGGEHRHSLNALGRLCGWLFRESQRPSQMTVMTGSTCLRSTYTFPCEMIRQSHLGYLLAWLRSRGGYEKRLSEASVAEKRPMSTSLPPELERDQLDNLVSRWRVESREGSPSASRTAKAIQHEIEQQALHRWELIRDAYVLLQADKRPINQGVEKLKETSLEEQWFQYHRIESNLNDDQDGPAFVPSTETDRHPAAAASRYMVHQTSSDLLASLLIHDDRELLWESIVAGDAFEGEIVDVHDEGEGRVTKPIWKILDKSAHQLRLNIGADVVVVGHPNRQGTIRNLQETKDGLLVEIEITNGKTARALQGGKKAIAPNSEEWIGQRVAWTTHTITEISRMKSKRVWNSHGPGAWLTHRAPTTSNAVVADVDVDDSPTVQAHFEKR